MLRVTCCLLFASALSLLLPRVHSLHFMAEAGKPRHSPPSPLAPVSRHRTDVTHAFGRSRCFLEDLHPNTVAVVNYEHKSRAPLPKAADGGPPLGASPHSLPFPLSSPFLPPPPPPPTPPPH